MDYVDNIGTSPHAQEYAESIADALWGTVFGNKGAVMTDGLLTWHDQSLDPSIVSWATRAKEPYYRACLDAFQDLDNPHIFI